jgi:anti-sigma factor RsiW
MISEQELARLGAFVDAELGLPEQLEIEQQLADDPRLQAEVQRLRQLSATLREAGDYHAAPAALRTRLSSAMAPRPALPAKAGGAHWRRWSGWPAWPGGPAALPALALVALLAAALLAGGGQAWWAAREEARLQDEVIASHVRSTLSQHLVDIASSDHHVVKPWLSARLDYSPAIPEALPPDLSFIGGRIDYLDSRPVAALSYRLHAHVVNAFVWPAAGADTAPAASAQRGYHLLHWRHDRMSWWLISDANARELAQVGAAFAHAGDRP